MSETEPAGQPQKAAAHETAGTPAQGFSKSYRIYALVLLLAVYTSNFVDRQILAILIEPIKADLGLTDTHMGFLSGVAFAIFYATLGIPIAMLADRWNRKRIITIALATWSFMTVLCGFALNFWQLALARIGVGVGEAGGTPPSHAIISDLFPPEERSTALGIFSLGVPFGLLIGFFFGGLIAENYGWRWAFFVLGAPGLLLAALVAFTLHEPKRGASEAARALMPGGAEAPPLREVLKFMFSQKSLVHIIIGATITTFAGYAFITWTPAFLIRSHGMSLSEAGMFLALIIGLAGGAGTFAGGWLSDRLGAADVRWKTRIISVVLVGATPFGIGVFVLDVTPLVLALMVLPSFVGAFYLAPTFALTQNLVGLRMRAVASAVLLFLINLIGMGGGPQVVGILSDVFSETMGQHSLRTALLIVTALNLWAALHFFIAARWLKEDTARALER